MQFHLGRLDYPLLLLPPLFRLSLVFDLYWITLLQAEGVHDQGPMTMVMHRQHLTLVCILVSVSSFNIHDILIWVYQACLQRYKGFALLLSSAPIDHQDGQATTSILGPLFLPRSSPLLGTLSQKCGAAAGLWTHFIFDEPYVPASSPPPCGLPPSVLPLAGLPTYRLS